MEKSDIIILVLNIIITIGSAIGAILSISYYKKSKHITIYARTNQALMKLDDMLKKLPEALISASSNKKGFNSQIAIQNIGKELFEHINL